MFRSSRFRRWITAGTGTLVVVLLVAAYLHATMAPPEDLDYSRSRMTDAGAFRATIKPQGGEPRVGRMHAWILHLETAAGQPVDAVMLEVDGGMPQHGHGYPTRPRVTRPLGGGDHLVEGVKFNMGGWWTMQFRIDAGGVRDSVTFNIQL